MPMFMIFFDKLETLSNRTLCLLKKNDLEMNDDILLDFPWSLPIIKIEIFKKRIEKTNVDWISEFWRTAPLS